MKKNTGNAVLFGYCKAQRDRRNLAGQPGKVFRKGSFTVEAALLMPLILFTSLAMIYLFLYVHNRACLTAAAVEAAVSGSIAFWEGEESAVEAAAEKAEAERDRGWFALRMLSCDVAAGERITVGFRGEGSSFAEKYFRPFYAEQHAGLFNPVKEIRSGRTASAF